MNRGLIGALTLSVAVALLGGCGGSSTRMGPIPHSQVLATNGHAAHSKSGSVAGLIYAIDNGSNRAKIDIFNYPSGTFMQQFTVPNSGSATGLCTDNDGNTFLTTEPQEQTFPGFVYEYSYGGTQPVATLEEDSYWPGACAWDGVSHDLAVANVVSSDGQGPGNVAIFHNAQGDPTYYRDQAVNFYYSATYDSDGDLLVLGRTTKPTILELPSGAQKLSVVRTPKKLNPNSIEWDGTHLAILDGSQLKKHSSPKVQQMQIANFKGGIVGTTSFTALGRKAGGAFAIGSSTVTLPTGITDGKYQFATYPYPQGGQPLSTTNGYLLGQMVVIVAPSR